MANDELLKLDVIEAAMARVSKQVGSKGLLWKQAAVTECSVRGGDVPSSLDGSFEGEPERLTFLRSGSNLRSIGGYFFSAAVGAALAWLALAEPNRLAAPPVLETAIRTPAAFPVAPITSPAKQSEVAPERSQAALDMLEHWRLAWSSRAVDSYLGFYSDHFVPADATNRSVWAEGRRKNLLSKSKIDVQIDHVKIASTDERQVKVQLLQSYESGGYKEPGRPKTLLLTREGNDWRIVGEWQGWR
jgi:hypothetical protein